MAISAKKKFFFLLIPRFYIERYFCVILLFFFECAQRKTIEPHIHRIEAEKITKRWVYFVYNKKKLKITNHTQMNNEEEDTRSNRYLFFAICGSFGILSLFYFFLLADFTRNFCHYLSMRHNEFHSKNYSQTFFV